MKTVEFEYPRDLMVAGRPCVLSVAGFDPSGGAGILADCKVFEAVGAYGLGVCSALTAQSDREFVSVDWPPFDVIESQLRPLARRFEVRYAKVGLVENLETLSKIVNVLNDLWSDIEIVWDPVGAASAGFEFHGKLEGTELNAVLKRLSLVTPNLNEISLLASGDSPDLAAANLSEHVPVLLKGGHGEGKFVRDALYADDRRIEFKSERIIAGAKHGSGCVLSAAIVGYRALGLPFLEAIPRAQEYIRGFLGSNESLLGFHREPRDERAKGAVVHEWPRDQVANF